MKTIALAAAALLLAHGAASAQAAADRECRNGGFASEQDAFGLGKVVGPGRLAFLDDVEGCPSAAPICAGRAYVTPGDVVITGRTVGPYVCAFFPNRVGGTAGWVLRARLAAVPAAAAPPPAAWQGRWREDDDEIRLTARGDLVAADGDAYWPSAHPSAAQRPGGPNIGGLQAQARPTGGRLRLSEGDGRDDCSAELWLVGPFLVVRDNNSCGGMNVTFSGVYRRR